MRLGARNQNAWNVSHNWVDMSRIGRVTPVNLKAAPQNVIFAKELAALLIIDMQNDFCSGKGWLDTVGGPYEKDRSPINPLNRLLPILRQADIPVLWINWGNRPDRMNLSPSTLHVYNPTGNGIGIGDILPDITSRVLQKGEWCAQVVDELDAQDQDIYVDKYRMSGFWDTPLDSILRNLDVKTLFFAGVNMDQCVMATLQDANFLGYDCILLEDCSATTSPDYCTQATLYNVRQCYGFTSRTQALIAGLRAAILHEEGDEI